MRTPKDLRTTPKDDWKYTQPETGKPFSTPHYKDLESQVWKHRHSLPHLGMDVSGGWKERFWHDVCLQNEHIPWVESEDKGMTVGVGDVIRCFQTLTNWTATGFQVVEPEEAEKRAEICTTCPRNEIVSACWGCRNIAGLVSSLAGHRTTSKDNALHVCSACGCLLRPKVWLPKEVLKVDQSKLPSFCWQKDGQA